MQSFGRWISTITCDMFKLRSVKTTIILRRQSRCRQFRDDDQEEDQEKLDAKG